MRSLLFILFFFTLIKLNAQVVDTTLTGIQIPRHREVILGLVNDFIIEGRKRNVWVGHFISSDLGAIHVLNHSDLRKITGKKEAVGAVYWTIQYDVLGYWYRIPTIGIREDMLYDYDLIKVVLYHELGHFLGLDHICCERLRKYGYHVMVTSINSDYKNDVISDEAMDDFFNLIKMKSSRHRYRKGSNNN
jgi:hypothetical protein